MKINGKPIDDETRCVHYNSSLDIIAIKFKCCNQYYPCFYCHEETAGHAAQVWNQSEFNTPAILCGKCKNEMTIAAYKYYNYQCPHCQADFNPRCRNHDHFYIET